MYAREQLCVLFTKLKSTNKKTMKKITFTIEEVLDFAKYCKENDITPNKDELEYWYIDVYSELPSLEEIKQMENDGIFPDDDPSVQFNLEW
jgi:hypothetical protein